MNSDKMIAVKLSFHGEVRRVQISPAGNYGSLSLSFSHLLATAKSIFQPLQHIGTIGKKISFLYHDEDGDVVHCSSDSEIVEAIRVMSSLNKRVYCFEIRVDSEIDYLPNIPKIKEEAVHPRITCDSCGVSPIVGCRFKCSVRDDFDLCAVCEKSTPQPYAMIKIYSSQQLPRNMVIVGNVDGETRRVRHDFTSSVSSPRRSRKQDRYSTADLTINGQPGGAWIEEALRENSHHPLANAAKMFVERFSASAPMPDTPAGLAPSPASFASQTQARHSQDKVVTPTAAVDERAPFIRAFDTFVGGIPLVGVSFTPPAPAEVPVAVPPSPAAAAAAAVGVGGESKSEVSPHHDAIPVTTEANARGDSPSEPKSPPLPPHQPNQDPCVEVEDMKAMSKVVSPVVTLGSPTGAAGAMSTPAPRQAYPPSAKLVRDVTFADKTDVVSGAVVYKTWLVKNSGLSQWPEGVTLVFTHTKVDGVPLISPPALPTPVPSVAPGEEVEVTVQLTMPLVTGEQISYFRLCTAEGSHFGQRLWAHVIVVEEDDWQMVSGIFDPSMPPSPPSEAAEGVASAPLSSSVALSSTANVSSAVDTAEDTHAAVLGVAPSAPSMELMPTISGTPPSPPAAEVGASIDTAVVEDDVCVWRAELRMLADMGFTETADLIPMLQQYVGVPVSLNPESNGVPEGEAMQRLVITLLGM